MKWQQDLIKDIRTHSAYDDVDDPPWGLAPFELSDCNLNAVKERFLSVRDNCRAILEIGVNNNGDRSITQLLLSLKSDSTIYIGIDIRDKSYLNNPEKNIYTIQCDSAQVEHNIQRIKELDVEQFDFMFLDGWHSINHMLADWEYTRLLSDGGIVGIHDTRIHPGPYRFVNALDKNFWEVEENVCRVGQDWGVGFVRKNHKNRLKNLKIGVVLTGISRAKSAGASNQDRDWTLTKDNIKHNIIDSLSQENQVSVYLTTYSHNQLDQLIEFYNPKKTTILPFSGSHQRTTYYHSMKSLENEDLDFVIATRFDLNFFYEFSNLNFDKNKFNITFREIEPWWSQAQFTNDGIFGFHARYLKDFAESIMDEQKNPCRPDSDLHPVYRHLSKKISPDDIHFLFEGCYNSASHHVYTIVRGNIV
jgi:hypothetical protein